jgi:hypothetical protein
MTICKQLTHILQLGVVLGIGPQPHDVLNRQAWVLGIESRPQQRARERRFNCCPAVARIAEAFFAAAAGQSFASDCSNAIRVEGPALVCY